MCAILENRSTTTIIESICCCILGSPSTKSMPTSSHCAFGAGKGVYNSAFVATPFDNCQTWHRMTNLPTSRFIFCHAPGSNCDLGSPTDPPPIRKSPHRWSVYQLIDIRAEIKLLIKNNNPLYIYKIQSTRATSHKGKIKDTTQSTGYNPKSRYMVHLSPPILE